MARIPTGTVKQFRKQKVLAHQLVVRDMEMTGGTYEATSAGAIPEGYQSVEINSVPAIITTIADASKHRGLFIVKHKSSSGGQNHFCNITTGTWNGTAKVAKLDAANEALAVYFDSAGNGTILENVGSVSLG